MLLEEKAKEGYQKRILEAERLLPRVRAEAADVVSISRAEELHQLVQRILSASKKLYREKHIVIMR